MQAARIKTHSKTPQQELKMEKTAKWALSNGAHMSDGLSNGKSPHEANGAVNGIVNKGYDVENPPDPDPPPPPRVERKENDDDDEENEDFIRVPTVMLGKPLKDFHSGGDNVCRISYFNFHLLSYGKCYTFELDQSLSNF